MGNKVAFKRNCYKITLADLLGEFPYNIVLQKKWSKEKVDHIFFKFKDRVDREIKYWRKENKGDVGSISEISQKIWDIKTEIEKEHPSSFSVKGWYDLKVWREAEGNEEELAKYQKNQERRLKEKEKRKLEEERLAIRAEQRRLETEEKEKARRSEIISCIIELGKSKFTCSDLKLAIKDIKARELKCIKGVKKVEDGSKKGNVGEWEFELTEDWDWIHG